MKATTVIGIVLIVLGLISLAYGGIPYKREKTVIDIGPVQARTETRERIPLPPLLGAASLAGGVILLVMGSRNKR